MPSLRRDLYERIRAAADESRRFHDCAAQVRVYDRDYRRLPDGTVIDRPVPAELLPRVYGGRYDAWLGGYVDEPPGKIAELSIHRGMLPVFDESRKERRTLFLGAPGSGKSEGAATMGVICTLLYPNRPGLIVAPVREKLTIAQKKYLAILRANGWLKDFLPANANRPAQALVVNGVTVYFVAAKKSSKAAVSPIAGFDAWWAVEEEQSGFDDDATYEVDARGRVNADFRVYSSATNEPIHYFQKRIARYEKNPHARVVRFKGTENVFTPLSHWDAIRDGGMSLDAFQRRYESLDIPQDGRAYPMFSLKESTQPLPLVGRDVTAEITAAKYRTPHSWIVGHDPGSLTTASVILKAFAGSQPNERLWYVVDEITTQDQTEDLHALELAKWFLQRGIMLADTIVIRDPTDSKVADRSDSLILKRRGFNVVRSNGGERIDLKHRYSMVNTLLCDVNRKRRLFLVPTPSGTPKADKLAESLGYLMLKPDGTPENHGKDKRDLTHWGDALGYALYPFERFRGMTPPGFANGQGAASPSRWVGHGA
ncbi:MAG TPA: hypothetical protein VEJ18_19185 [Planctomycetota bacterium]|nr:hypothetical protein [Planctomycetota bacterium]